MTTNVLDRGKIRVGILRGGPSHEYEVSLKTGSQVLENLPNRYAPQDIFISRDGEWHVGGLARNPERALSQVDVVFNALHGKYGEDGKVQSVLETFGKPYTGSRSFPSALAMHKGLTKNYLNLYNIKNPYHAVLGPSDNTRKRVVEIFQSFPQPSVVKPVNGGSSQATIVARDFATFEKAVENAFRYSGSVLIEEFIAGREATCGVLDSADAKSAYALFPVEMKNLSSDKDLLGYDAKYSNDLHEFDCPGTFSRETQGELQELALVMHMALGLRHYSRSDFIVSPNRGIYALEINSLPTLAAESLYPKSLSAAGLTFPEFLEHIIGLALAT